MAEPVPERFAVGTMVVVIKTGVVGVVVAVDSSPKYRGECKHTVRSSGGDTTEPGSNLRLAESDE
jgi:hypothetical protein